MLRLRRRFEEGEEREREREEFEGEQEQEQFEEKDEEEIRSMRLDYFFLRRFFKLGSVCFPFEEEELASRAADEDGAF